MSYGYNSKLCLSIQAKRYSWFILAVVYTPSILVTGKLKWYGPYPVGGGMDLHHRQLSLKLITNYFFVFVKSTLLFLLNVLNWLFWYHVFILNVFKKHYSFSSMLKKTFKITSYIFFSNYGEKMTFKILFRSLSL